MTTARKKRIKPHFQSLLPVVAGIFVLSQHAYGDDPLLSALEKVAAYCERIESATFSFACEETIAQRVYFPYKGWVKKGGKPVYYKKTALSQAKVTKRLWKFLYQADQDRPGIKETRFTLNPDGSAGQPVRSLSEVGLVPFPCVSRGPAGMLSAFNQDGFEFRLLGREEINGQTCLVIEAMPVSALKDRFGKAWIAEATGAVLKISWSPRSLQNFEIIDKSANDLHNRKNLSIVTEMISEYHHEMEGIRFPTRFTVLEKYSTSTHSEVICSELTVEYSRYRFSAIQVKELEPESDSSH